MKEADIHLPYFKQGTDLEHHLSQNESVEDALLAHADQLEYAAKILRSIQEIVAGQGVKFEADTHMIMASGPDEIIEALIDAKYASVPSWMDDEDDVKDQIAEEPAPKGWDSIF